MANMFDSPDEPDDVSLFIRRILLRSSPASSSSSSSSLMVQKVNEMQCLVNSNVLHGSQSVQSVSGSDRMTYLAGSSSGLNSGAYFSLTGGNLSSCSVGAVDNEIDEYVCESEEGLAEAAPAKPAPSRSSSKRGRAAEVHNLSEKRRRGRINEKMKALQNLIPNSNKTDKASMLDEAIEYLKQLQLQVQVKLYGYWKINYPLGDFSEASLVKIVKLKRQIELLQMLTMRNGLSLYPMCPPGAVNPYQFPQRKMDFYEGQASLKIMDQATLPKALSMPDHYTIPKQTSVSNNLSAIDSVTSFGWESSHVGSFELPGFSKGICDDKMFSCQHINQDHPSTGQMGCHIGGAATEAKDNTLQASLLARYQPDNVSLKDLEREAFVLPQMDGMSIDRSAHIKTESGYF